MVAKTFFLGLALLVLWQGAAGQAPSLQDVMAAALNQTADLAAAPQSAAQTVSEQLQSVSQGLVLSGEGVYTASLGRLNEVSARAQEAVDKALGVCMEGQLDASTQLVLAAAAGVVRCVTDQLAAVSALVGDVAALAGRAVLLPHRAAQDITACLQFPLTAVFCAAEAAGKWGQAALDITDALATDARKGAQLWASGPADIAACAVARVNTAVATVNQIIAGIAQCVVNSSNSTNQASSKCP